MSRMGLTGPSEKKCSLSVMRHSVAGRGLLLARQDDVDATVFLPAALGAVVGDWLRGAEADGLDSCRIDAARQQCVANGSGAPLGKCLVGCGIADGVRVTFDANRALGIDVKQLRQSIDRRDGA